MATLFQIIQFLDGNGDPLSYGKIFTDEAGTTTPKDTWVDQAESAVADNPIILDNEGRISDGQNGLWMRGSYKFTITDAGGTPVPGGVIDNINEYDQRDWTGLTATIADLNSTTTTARIVNSVTTLTITDRNKTILADATSGNFNIILPSAGVVGDKYRIFIKKINKNDFTATVVTAGFEEIEGKANYIFQDYNDGAIFHSDGNNWYVLASNLRRNLVGENTSRPIILADEKTLIVCDASAGVINLTLPNPAFVGRGYEIAVKKGDASANPINILPNGAEVIDGIASLSISEQNVAYSLETDGVNWFIRSSHDTNASNDYPWGYIYGMDAYPTAPDPLHIIVISPGVARDAGNNVNLRLASALNKRIDLTWVEGNNQGGFPAISILPNTWYYTFSIGKPSGVTDGGFDNNTSATNLLAVASGSGYTTYRRIASFRTDAGSNIIPYLAYSIGLVRNFVWTTKINDFIDTGAIGTFVRTLRVPPVQVEANISIVLEDAFLGDVSYYFHSTLAANQATLSSGISTICLDQHPTPGPPALLAAQETKIFADTSSNISYTSDPVQFPHASTLLTVSTRGWTDYLTI